MVVSVMRRVTSTLAGNEVMFIEAERLSHIREEEDGEPRTYPVIKTEPNVTRGCMCSEKRLLMLGTTVPKTCRAVYK
jgi:hypothetical protein